jgi:hypothetical protein
MIITTFSSHFEALGSYVNKVLHFNFLYNYVLNDLYYQNSFANFICPLTYRCHCHPFHLGCQLTMSFLCLNHLLTCITLMASGQWLRPHVPLSLFLQIHKQLNTMFCLVFFIFIDKSFYLAWIHLLYV